MSDDTQTSETCNTPRTESLKASYAIYNTLSGGSVGALLKHYEQLERELNALQSKLEKLIGATGLNNLSELCVKIEHWQRIEKEVMTMPRPCTDNDKHRLTSPESEQSQVGAHLQSKPVEMKSAEDWRDKYFGISGKCNFWKSHYNFSAVEFEVVIQAIQQDLVEVIEQLKADKARLDWFNINPEDYIGVSNDYVHESEPHKWMVCRNKEEFEAPYQQGFGNTFREAIDNAIKQSTT